MKDSEEVTPSADTSKIVDDITYLSIDDISNTDLKKWLNSLGRYLRDNLLITELGDKFGWSIKLYTATYVYSIRARPNEYLGAVVSCRSPRAGEKHTRGSDLSDGKFCFETWHKILCDIVAYEKVVLCFHLCMLSLPHERNDWDILQCSENPSFMFDAGLNLATIQTVGCIKYLA